MSYVEGLSSEDNDTKKASSKTAGAGKDKSRNVGSRLLGQELSPSHKAKPLFEAKPPAELPDRLKNAEPVSEERAPDKDLSPEEVSLLVPILREESRRQRLTEPEETPEQVALHQAVDIYDDKLKYLEPEAAAEETLAEMGIEGTDLDDEVQAEDDNEVEDEPTELTHQDEVLLNNLPDPEDEPDDDVVVANPASPPPPPPPHRPTATGGAATPPLPPSRPPYLVPSPPPPYVPGQNPNFMSNNITMTQAEYVGQRRDDFMNGAIIGGIVGYLIGRRRGRIKTEKKLLPIQKRLEKKVVKLEDRLNANEYKVKKLVSKNFEKDQKIKYHEDKQRAAKFEKRAVAAAVLQETTANESRQRAPEASVLHVAHKAPERIGQLIVLGESSQQRRPERPTKPKPEAHTEASSSRETMPVDARRVETMNRQELMDISQKIVVEGSTLRQIYETHLVGEKGLRRLVSEHLKGHDVKKALRQEIVEREIDFERDPVLRDMSNSTGSSSSSSQATLDSMISRVENVVAPSVEETAFYKAKADYEAKELARATKRKRTTDGLIAGTVVVLLAVIVVLFLTRG